MHKVLLIRNCPYTLTDKLDVRRLTGMKILNSFTKLTRIILSIKLNYYRLFSVFINNIYICKNNIKRIQYLQTILLLTQIILLLT